MVPRRAARVRQPVGPAVNGGTTMAPLASALDNLAVLVRSVLAVLAGAVAGALLTAAIVWLVCRYSSGRQPPVIVRKLVRWLGAIAGALAVAAFMQFGLGGSGRWGLFGGGLGTGTQGNADSHSTSSSARDSASTRATQPVPEVKESAPAKAQRVRIVVLGG